MDKRKKWDSIVLREIKNDLCVAVSNLRSLKVRNYYGDGRIVAIAKLPNKQRIYVRARNPYALINKFLQSAIELTGASHNINK